MKYYTVLCALAGLMFVPAVTHAFDIDYASVQDIAGDTVLLKYRTTDDYTFALCSFSGECGEKLYGETVGNTRPTLFPTIVNQTNYTQSPDGTYAVVNFATLNDITYRSLHRIDNEDASYVRLVPYTASALRTSVTYANDAVVFLGTGGVITRFDIETGELKSVETNQTSFPFLSYSEHGNLAAWYDYTSEAQTVFNVTTGERTLFPTGTPSYAVFNDSETSVAYLGEVDGFNKLLVASLSSPLRAQDVDAGNYTVVEYEFIGDMLYYIANTERDPYEWNLYSYNSVTNERAVADSDVAYDDEYTNLKKTHTALLYEKVNGTHKDVVVFEPAKDTRVVLRASDVEDRDIRRDTEREVVRIAGVPGVLLSPENARRNTPLIVWLHGGPMRQTSLGFHPFYGYAVYDEILERFAEEAYILKLDYAGSWGHGNNRLDALQNQIGVRDVQDVLRAIEEMKEEYDISDVYLFGPSYGGYLALRTLVEAPEEIESVVSIAGVTDWTSLVTRIPSSIFARHFSGVPNTLNLNQYAAASIRDRLRELDDQNMLLIYGEDDSTVPTWQSKEFYDHASSLNKNIELVGYEEEGHTILKKENLRDVCERTAETFGLSVSLCEE
ncbi:MAG: alpha/beta fold hydrolase [Candidatus Paceibacterota bacterium]